MGNKCSFRSEEGIETVYTPFDIKAFRFTNSKYYVSRDLNGKLAFLEYLVKGKVNVYYQRDSKGDHYYMDNETIKLSEIPYKEEIRHVREKDIFTPNKVYIYRSPAHKNFLALYLQDAPQLKSRIYKIKKPEHHSLIVLAEDYHNIVCKDERCVVYDKKPPIIKIDLESEVGMVYYSNQEDLNDNNYIHVGVLAHFWMPRVNEKLFFRSGVLYSTLRYEENESLWKFPLQLEYISPKGKIRPKFAFGINLYKPLPLYQSIALMGGVNINLSNKIFWSINYDVDFYSIREFPLIPDKLLSNSLAFGVYFKL